MSGQAAEKATEKSLIEKIRELPLLSGLVSAAGALTLTETVNPGMLLFAAPLASAAVAVSGALNAFDKKRSGLSRVFSAAAAIVGTIGAVAPFVIAGPEALGAIFLSLGTMTMAGAFNVAAHFLRNKKLPFTVAVKKTETPAPAPAPVA